MTLDSTALLVKSKLNKGQSPFSGSGNPPNPTMIRINTAISTKPMVTPLPTVSLSRNSNSAKTNLREPIMRPTTESVNSAVLQNFANLEIDNSGYGSDRNLLITATYTLGLGEDVYIIDSGATKHMVMDKSLIINQQPITPVKVKYGDGSGLVTTLSGSLTLGPMVLNNVLYARLNGQPDLCVWHQGWQMSL